MLLSSFRVQICTETGSGTPLSWRNPLPVPHYCCHVKCLIIGGNGFVGRNLTLSLVRDGHSVTIMDRHTDDQTAPVAETIVGDAQDSSLVVDALAGVKPDVVYHLAANSDIAAGVQDSSLDFGDTLMTTCALRTALQRVPVQQLVFASSSAIFGVSDSPLSEQPEDVPAPVSWYGKAKLASEYVLESVPALLPDCEILFVRFPNVVGPLATHGVVFDFVRKLRADSSQLDVLGDGYQTKPYLHVSELLEGIEFFRTRLRPGVTRINIGPPDLVDVRGIVAEVCEVLNAAPRVVYQDSPVGWPGDVPRYEFDSSAMKAAGFTITTSSREAVRRAAEDIALESGQT